MSGVTEILWTDTKIKLGPDQAWRDLETRQYNFTASGSRLAYMNARMAAVIPFEGGTNITTVRDICSALWGG